MENYREEENGRKKEGQAKYLNLVQMIRNREINFLEIHQEDLEEFLQSKGEKGRKLYQNLLSNTKRYVGILSQIANSFDEIKRKTPLTEEEEFDLALQNCRLESLEKDNWKQTNPEAYQKLKNLL